MHKLLKTINKFNGNICFVGATDSGDYVFECDRQSQVLTYDLSNKLISDVCLYNGNTYSVVFSNQYIGTYSGGVLNETFIDTGLSCVKKILRNTSGAFYIFNGLTNELIKYDSGVIWTLALPDYTLRTNGNICLRESDSVIIYYNNENIHIIRDDLTKGTTLNSLTISTTSDNLRVVIGNEFNPAYTYLRARTVGTPEILQSSSTSNSSCSSSSNSSSSYSSNSSSSYVENWSSSSYSSSSSLSSLSSLSSGSSLSSSSTYIVNWSTSSSSGDILYVTGSGLTPAVTGTYTQGTDYGGYASYTNGTYWIYYVALYGTYVIYTIRTINPGGSYFYNSSSSAVGNYVAAGTYVGNPVVSQ